MKWPYPQEYVKLIYDTGYGWNYINPRWCSLIIYVFKFTFGKKVRLSFEKF